MPKFLLIFLLLIHTLQAKEISDEQIKKVGIVNCAAIIFPYLREHLADLTRRSGLPPFHLPPINFVKVYKDQTTNDS